MRENSVRTEEAIAAALTERGAGAGGCGRRGCGDRRTDGGFEQGANDPDAGPMGDTSARASAPTGRCDEHGHYPSPRDRQALRRRTGSCRSRRGKNFGPGRLSPWSVSMGPGKSTLMRLLLGMLRPDSGTAEVLGCPVVDADLARSRVGHLIETVPVWRVDCGGIGPPRGPLAGVGIGRRRATPMAAIIADLGARPLAASSDSHFVAGQSAVLGSPWPWFIGQMLVLDEPSNSSSTSLGVVRVREPFRCEPVKTESRS